MRGLIRKEFYTILTLYRKNLLMALVLYMVLGLVMQRSAMGNVMIWMAGFYILGCSGADQLSGWERYARTLPVSDKQIVGSRMLANLLVQSLAGAYAMVMTVMISLMKGEPLLESVVSVVIIMAVAVISMGVMIPASYKWGAEKARILFTMFFCLMFVLLYLVVERMNVNWAAIEITNGGAWMAAVVGVTALVYVLGYVVSCRIYQKKEF